MAPYPSPESGPVCALALLCWLLAIGYSRGAV
jgi:hypothetical protein